jgi:hypothetical protein
MGRTFEDNIYSLIPLRIYLCEFRVPTHISESSESFDCDEGCFEYFVCYKFLHISFYFIIFFFF